MFEHFGLRDVLSGAVKFKYVFFAVMVVSILGGGMIQYKNARANATSDPNDGSWAATAYFSVDDNNYVGSPGTDAADGKETEVKRFAATYQAIIKSDLSNAYVYDQIVNDMGKKEFLAKAKLGISEEDFKSTDLTKLVTSKVLDSTSTVSIVITSGNKTVSSQLLQYYTDYLMNHAQQSIKENTLTELGSTINPVAESGSKTSRPMILAIGFGIILYFLFVFTWTLFWPTVNRKSDFEKYDVRVIQEL